MTTITTPRPHSPLRYTKARQWGVLQHVADSERDGLLSKGFEPGDSGAEILVRVVASRSEAEEECDLLNMTMAKAGYPGVTFTVTHA